MLDLVGQRLGQYRIEARIARGATSTIYKAYQEKLDRYVAIKVLSPHFVDEPGFRDRFYQEARAVARLDHPNILPVYDFDQLGETVYIVMKYVDTGTLRHIMQGPMDLALTVEIITQIGLALGYAHRQGVVHRDVKPGNILIADNNWALLTDFGLAKMLDAGQRLTRTGAGVGTPEYISPEQAQGKAVDGRADLYSLGAMLYEMLTGHLPFESESGIAMALKHVTDPVTPPCVYRSDLPPAVEQVILKSLEKEPDRRYASAEVMLAALTRAVSSASTAEVLESPGDAARPSDEPASAKSQRRLKLAASWMALRRQADQSAQRLRAWGLTQRGRFSTSQDWIKPFANRRALAMAAGIVLVMLMCGVLVRLTSPASVPAATMNMTPDSKAPLLAVSTVQPLPTRTLAPVTASTVMVPTAPPLTVTPEISVSAPPGMALIPAGTFTMGAVAGEFEADETPPHVVYLDDYYIDNVEVTNAQFARFVAASGYQTDAERAGDATTWHSFNSPDRQRFPVIFVSWNDATRYCAWLSKRLPTEAEWENAARGATKRIYPWGNTFDSKFANTLEAGIGQPVAVGSRSAQSPYGLWDMSGNVWEMVQDWYDGGYYTDSPKSDPSGPVSGLFKVIRGGSFKTQPERATTTVREKTSQDSRGDDVGFRCARDAK